MPLSAAIRIISRASNDTPSTSRIEFMTPEQNPASTTPPQIPIGPPEGPISRPKAIFWNEREFRAGWRLLVYIMLVALFGLAETFLIKILHLPTVNRLGLTVTSTLVQEISGLIAVFAAAAIMGKFEARP